MGTFNVVVENIKSFSMSINDPAWLNDRTSIYIKNINFPDSMTNIEDYAFYHMFIYKITLENNITSIGSDVFGGCYELSSVQFSNNVTSIGSDTFYDCFSLSSLTIPNSVTSIGGGAFLYMGHNYDHINIIFQGKTIS